MVKALIESASSFSRDLASYVPPGFVICVATAFIEGGKYMSSFRQEFFGTLVMIGLTFSAGKWIGKDSQYVSWLAHAIGVIAADYFTVGPHVNPAATFAMAALGKCSYTESYVRIAAQIAGGLVAFPTFHAMSHKLGLTPFGGPEYHDPETAAGFSSEFISTLLLMLAIYILNWELNFGRYHYIIKQALTAAVIRALIEVFPTSGPAMNPMLATTWDVFAVGTSYAYSSDFSHYFVYWIAPFTAAFTSAVLWAMFSGGTIFGRKMPIGPLRKAKTGIKVKVT